MEHGEDFVVADDLSSLVQGMNKVTGENLIDEDHLQAQIAARDLQIDNSFSKDA